MPSFPPQSLAGMQAMADAIRGTSNGVSTADPRDAELARLRAALDPEVLARTIQNALETHETAPRDYGYEARQVALAILAVHPKSG